MRRFPPLLHCVVLLIMVSDVRAQSTPPGGPAATTTQAPAPTASSPCPGLMQSPSPATATAPAPSGAQQSTSPSNANSAQQTGTAQSPAASQVTVNVGATDTSGKPASSNPSGSVKPVLFPVDLPSPNKNAVDIASAFSGKLPGIVSVTAVADNKLLFVLDGSQIPTQLPNVQPPLQPTLPDFENYIKGFLVPQLASAQSLSAQSAASKSSTAKPTKGELFIWPLPPGYNNASDIATALSGFPGVLSVTAIADNKLVFVLDVSPKAGAGQTGSPSAQLEMRLAQLVSNTPSIVFPIRLPPDTGNASDIASKLAGSIPGVLSIVPVGDTRLLFTLDQTPDPKTPNKPRDIPKLEADISRAVEALAVPYPVLYMVPFPLGAGKNCDIASALMKQIPGVVNILPVGSTRLAFAIDRAADTPTLHRSIDTYVRELAEPLTPPYPNTDSDTVRLYYEHDPTVVASLATIVSNAYPEIKAAVAGPDTIVLSETLDRQVLDEAADDDPLFAKLATKRDPLADARRMIAKIDQPRPQVSLSAWSIQVSASKQEAMISTAPEIQKIAKEYNDAISKSTALGWRFLTRLIQDDRYFDPYFASYLTFPTHAIRRPDQTICCTVTNPTAEYSDGQVGYALGYMSLFKPLRPNLVYWLVTLAASGSPDNNTNRLIDEMEGPAARSALAAKAGQSCDARDRAVYDQHRSTAGAETERKGPGYLQLECVRDELTKRLFRQNGYELGTFRAAIADFLFQYKMTVEYPNNFQPYEFSAAAASLDTQLSPVVDAFTTDLEVFQWYLANDIEGSFGNKHITYAASGIVSVKVVAGNPASVQTQTQNYFDATPPATLGDYAAAIKSIGTPSSGGSSSGGGGTAAGKVVLPALLTSNMTTNEAIASLAAIQALSGTPVRAHIGKGLTLSATAYSLSGASGAEMDIQVESNENGAELVTASTESNLNSQTVQNDDLASRVSDHKVQSRVRVDSLKLFDLSTMQSVLARGKAPWMPVDPWLEIPVLNYVVRVPRKPDLSFHRSFIFINALIVPTAADLASGIAVTEDQVKLRDNIFSTARNLEELGTVETAGRIREYHRLMLDWFMSSTSVADQISYIAPAPSFANIPSIGSVPLPHSPAP